MSESARGGLQVAAAVKQHLSIGPAKGTKLESDSRNCLDLCLDLLQTVGAVETSGVILATQERFGIQKAVL